MKHLEQKFGGKRSMYELETGELLERQCSFKGSYIVALILSKESLPT